MEQLSSGLYLPVYVLALAAVALFVASQMLHSREAHERAESMADLGFGAALLAGAYVGVLFLYALVSAPDQLYDAALIIVIVGVFFLVLLFLMFAIGELIFSRGERKAIAPEND